MCISPDSEVTLSATLWQLTAYCCECSKPLLLVVLSMCLWASLGWLVSGKNVWMGARRMRGRILGGTESCSPVIYIFDWVDFERKVLALPLFLGLNPIELIPEFIIGFCLEFIRFKDIRHVGDLLEALERFCNIRGTRQQYNLFSLQRRHWELHK